MKTIAQVSLRVLNRRATVFDTGFIQKIATIFQRLFKDHLLGIQFQRLYKNAHSQSILIRLKGLNCFLTNLSTVFIESYLLHTT